MGSVGRWTGGLRTSAIVAVATSLTACGSIQNMIPDPANFKLPDRTTILPPTSSSYAAPLSATNAVGPADLVDGQGQCAGPTASDPAAPARGVSLDMTECQVVRALGQPQAVDDLGGTLRTVPSAIIASNHQNKAEADLAKAR